MGVSIPSPIRKTLEQAHQWDSHRDTLHLSISCRKFNDGFPNVFVKDATRIRSRHVAFLASFQDAATIFEQLSVIYQLPRMFVGSFTLVLPYFPTGTAERVRCPSCAGVVQLLMLHVCVYMSTRDRLQQCWCTGRS